MTEYATGRRQDTGTLHRHEGWDPAEVEQVQRPGDHRAQGQGTTWWCRSRRSTRSTRPRRNATSMRSQGDGGS